MIDARVRGADPTPPNPAAAEPGGGASESGDSARRRRCIATGESGDPSLLVRFVLGPEGQVVPDIEERLPGRGVWVTAGRDPVERAARKRLFARAFRSAAESPPDLADQVERSLARQCLNLLGLARRAGQVVVGFEKVRASLPAGRVAALIRARDGSSDGARRLRAAAPDVPAVELFAAAELGRALGRDIVVHAALVRGRLAQRFLREAGRLAGFRALPPSDDERP